MISLVSSVFNILPFITETTLFPNISREFDTLPTRTKPPLHWFEVKKFDLALIEKKAPTGNHN